MIEIRLFTQRTCEEILNYRNDDRLRGLYNAEKFECEILRYLPEIIRLDMEESDKNFGISPADDLNNSIKLFNALKQIDLVQANDKRLWTTLTHTLFFRYVKERWQIAESSSDNVIKDRFHYEGLGLRARNQNAIARLWWASKITYDERRNDPFELTRILLSKQDFYQNLIDRKFSTYSGTLHGFLTFFKDNPSMDLKTDMRRLFKGLNAFGGSRVLSLMGEKEIVGQLQKLCRYYGIKYNG